jgi:CO/xanthine dehydrogenase FAD-binding subunit
LKPPAFSYVRAKSVDDAVEQLAGGNGEAKLIAGGQSLMPMLNFRLLAPETLIDISRIPGLDLIEKSAGGLSIGAGVRHRQLLESPVVAENFPVVREVMAHVAHLAIRNRGTIGGSICHADPAAELPMLMLLLDATITAVGPEGERPIKASDFFEYSLTTSLAEDEMVTGIHLPSLPEGAGWGFTEIARRHGDFALAGAAAIIVGTDVRIAVMGVHETPIRVPEAERILVEGGEIDSAISAIRAAIEPNDDLQASADYRRHLVGVLSGRVIRQVMERAA